MIAGAGDAVDEKDAQLGEAVLMVPGCHLGQVGQL